MAEKPDAAGIEGLPVALAAVAHHHLTLRSVAKRRVSKGGPQTRCVLPPFETPRCARLLRVRWYWWYWCVPPAQARMITGSERMPRRKLE